jgi:hypothetical protein
MSTPVNEAVAKKIARLFRMFGSPFEGEAHNALRAMQHLLEAEGLTFNDVAVLIENASGEIRELKYSDDDANIIFTRGVEKGHAEAARQQELPPECYNVDGSPRWFEIASFCQQNSMQQKNGKPLLSTWDQDFISDMPSKIIRYGKPTAKQIPFLVAIFIKLGGHYEPKAFNLRS